LNRPLEMLIGVAGSHPDHVSHSRTRFAHLENLPARRLPRVALLLLLSSLCAICSFASPASQQPSATPPAAAPAAHPPSAPPAKLKPEQTLEKSLSPGETQSFLIHLKKGQFFHAEVEQAGVDVLLVLSGPDGKLIAKMDTLNSTFGPEKISTITTSRGNYRLDVASDDDKAPAGLYRLTIARPRKPIPQDQSRIAAEKNMADGTILFNQDSVDAHHHALQEFLDAAKTWHDLGDGYEEALALASAAELQSGFDQDQDALKGYLTALPLFHASGEADGEAQDLDNVALQYNVLLDKPHALDYYAQAIVLWRQLNNRANEATDLNHLGLIHYAQGDNRGALTFYQQALPIKQAVGDRIGEADVLNNIGLIYDEFGDRKKALDFYMQALPIKRQLGDRGGEATVLSNIGYDYNSQGDPKKALDYYQQALKIKQELGDKNGQATGLNNVGLTYDGMGEKEKALGYYNQALALADANKNRALECTINDNIGRLYYTLGDSHRAIDFYNKAMIFAGESGDKSSMAGILTDLGLVYEDLGEEQKAIEFYNQALPLRKDVGDPVGLSTTLNDLGTVYDNLDQEEKALDFYNQALPLEQSAGDVSGEAATLSNMGTIYDDLKQQQKALDYFNQALPLKQKVSDPAGEAVILSNIGRIYARLNDNAKALDYFGRALTLGRQVGDRDGQARTLSNFAKVYMAQGDKEKALDNFLSSLELMQEVHDPIGEGNVLTSLMHYWRDEKQTETAIFFGKQAINQFQEVRSNIKGLEAESQKSFVKSREGTYRDVAGLLIAQGRLYEAEQVLVLLKDQEYFDFIRRDTRGAAALTAPVPLTSGETEVDKQFRAISDRVTAIGNDWAMLRAKPSRTPEEEQHLSDLSSQIVVANQEWSEFLKNMYTSLQTTGQAQKSVRNLQENASGMQKVLRQLDPGTVAIYTLVGDDKYQVIVVTPNVVVAREYPITAADLRKKVLDFRQELSTSDGEPLAGAQDLYTILVGPIEKDLEGAKATTLLWSLDDVLRYVPMAALNDGQHYMVEKYRTAVFTPSSVADLTDKPDVHDWQGLGMGVSKAYGDFPALPSVPGELQSVIQEGAAPKGVMPGEVLLDNNFTVANMRKALEESHPLVHIASHFYFSPGNETNSFLLLGGDDPHGAHLTLAQMRDDPSFDFSQTKLLTLSACDTAMGGAEGDGREVDGLGNVAHDKGAEAVLASLWAVNDKSTGLLMQEMYRLWTTAPGMSKSEALRRAQVSLLLDPKAPYSSPYYWAPFVLIGNPR
jgi:CHAT domain-containing protein/tetratricopeptide (TPR) repeat protein